VSRLTPVGGGVKKLEFIMPYLTPLIKRIMARDVIKTIIHKTPAVL
jgi:hypothetical protein